jgi:SSS family solute:Na+ symporter
MFAAAMSSIDSGVNSISAVVTTDFIDRFRRSPRSERGHVRLAQALALVVGVIVVTASSYMEYVPGNFLEMTKRTHELMVPPLFVLFLLALFVPCGTQVGALVGAFAAFVTGVAIAYQHWVTGTPEISFQWILPGSLAAGVIVGCAVSLLSTWLLRCRR